MVDATGMGTVCMTLRHKRDLDILFDALGGESGLELTKDVILGTGDSLEMIDEKKSLALIGKEVVHTADEARQKFKEQHGLIGQGGKFQNSVKVAFFNMKAVESSVGGIATQLKQKDAEKKQKEEDKLEAEEHEEDMRDIGGKQSYYPTAREWDAPETAAEDCRKADTRSVSAGDPQKLEAVAANTIKRDKTRPNWRPITRYMVGEPDQHGDFKVYVEQEEVVNCEAAQIQVEFLSSSYSIRVETGEEPLVLGPVECGQIDIRASKWRLSKGKRLTITVMKARTSASTKSVETQVQEAVEGKPAKEGQQEGIFAQILMSLLSIVPVLLAFWYMKGSGSS